MYEHLNKEQLTKFLAVARNASARDGLMFHTAFMHGLRVSEVIALSSKNLRGEILIVKRLKGSRKTSQPASAELLAYSATLPAGTRFFDESRFQVLRLFKRYGREAGIPEILLHTHVLKHAVAHAMLDGGASIPEIQCRLGHVNGQNTLKYLEVSEETSSRAFSAAVGSF